MLALWRRAHAPSIPLSSANPSTKFSKYLRVVVRLLGTPLSSHVSVSSTISILRRQMDLIIYMKWFGVCLLESADNVLKWVSIGTIKFVCLIKDLRPSRVCLKRGQSPVYVSDDTIMIPGKCRSKQSIMLLSLSQARTRLPVLRRGQGDSQMVQELSWSHVLISLMMLYGKL